MCKELLLGMDNERDRMKIESPNMTYNGIGLLHIRNRVKFYVSEEVFIPDGIKNEGNVATLGAWKGNHNHPILQETKNYRRVEDGIISKSGANFSSMVMIFDRRGSK